MAWSRGEVNGMGGSPRSGTAANASTQAGTTMDAAESSSWLRIMRSLDRAGEARTVTGGQPLCFLFGEGRCPSGPGSRASHRGPAKPGPGPFGLRSLSRAPRQLPGSAARRADSGLVETGRRRRTRQIRPQAVMLTVSVGDTTMESKSRTSNTSRRSLVRPVLRRSFGKGSAVARGWWWSGISARRRAQAPLHRVANVPNRFTVSACTTMFPSSPGRGRPGGWRADGGGALTGRGRLQARRWTPASGGAGRTAGRGRGQGVATTRHKVFVSFHEKDRKYRKLFAKHMGSDVVDRTSTWTR